MEYPVNCNGFRFEGDNIATWLLQSGDSGRNPMTNLRIPGWNGPYQNIEETEQFYRYDGRLLNRISESRRKNWANRE